MFEFLPPGLILLLGALLVAVTRGVVRGGVLLLAPVLTLGSVWLLPDGVSATVSFLGYDVELVEGSAVRRLFASGFCIMAFAGGLYAWRSARGYELAAALAYAAGAVGVAFAGDLIALFLCWELMAIFSTVVLFSAGTDRARAAGLRYAIIHLLAGVVFKVGIEAISAQTGSFDLRALGLESFGAWMIMVAVLVNVAAPPVSAWLTDAYPEASPAGTVLLSGFTTKTAVLALMLLFPGAELLVYAGLIMMVYGIVFGLLENDVRRLLAYALINQLGFMVTAVGIGSEMALNGAMAMAFAQTVYQGLLFMSAGVVIYQTGRNRCSDLGGLFRGMPVTGLCGIVGALSIAGLPLTSGFITRVLIVDAAWHQGMTAVTYLLVAASAGVVLHAGMKFPWFVFFNRNSGLRPDDAPWNMALAMGFLAVLSLCLGLFPQPLYSLLPYPVTVEPYAAGKVLFYLQLLLFSGLAFFVMLPLIPATRTTSLETDWLYRRLLPLLWRRIADCMGAIKGRAMQDLRAAARSANAWLQEYWADEGIFARSWPIGLTALWIAVLLIVYVLVYYL